MHTIGTAERRARLVSRHLEPPAGGPCDVAHSMVGLHSSDPATVYLSLRARLTDFTREHLQEDLYEDRSLVRLLGMRKTLFVVPRGLGAVIDAACTRALGPAERRRLVKILEEQSVADGAERWVARVCAATLAAIEERGEALASELREDVPELKLKLRFGEGKSWAGEVGVSTRILFLLATEGRILRGRPRGSWLSSQYRWVSTEAWLGGAFASIDKAEAQNDLVIRWLRQFGPGTMNDLKWWTGWTMRDTRAALKAVDAVEVRLEEGTGFVLSDDLDVPRQVPSETAPSAALLPSLDPTPMGWKERTWFLGPHSNELFDRNGNVGPTVWSNGRIVGGWAQDESGDVIVETLEPVSDDEAQMIEEEQRRLSSWLDGDRVMPRFPTPLQKRLAGR